MKKYFLMILFIFSVSVFGNIREIPKDILNEIKTEAKILHEDNLTRNSYISWQVDAYLDIEKLEKILELPHEEYSEMKDSLYKIYGVDFVKQYKLIKNEIDRKKKLDASIKIATTKEVERILLEKKLSEIKEEINEKAEKELKVIEKTVEIPQVIMERFKAEAERLYPGNYYEQKRYIESSIGNYKFYKNLK